MGGAASPVYEALGTRLVGEVPGGVHPLRLLGEQPRKHLVRVGELSGGPCALAALDPEQLRRQFAVSLLALDQRRHVLLQASVVRLPPVLGGEQVVHDVGVHRADGVERQPVLADGLGPGGNVALAHVQCGGDVCLARPSLGEHHGDLLALGHGHRAPLRHSAPYWAHVAEL